MLSCGDAIAGIAVFSNKSSSQVTRKLASPNAPLGYMLCFANLMLDGYTLRQLPSTPCAG